MRATIKLMQGFMLATLASEIAAPDELTCDPVNYSSVGSVIHRFPTTYRILQALAWSLTKGYSIFDPHPSSLKPAY